MGVRGPLPKRTAQSARTAKGVKLRKLPDEFDAIFLRLVRDVPDLIPADVPMVEDQARWISIAKEAYRQLADVPQTIEKAIERLLLTVTDTAHGNKEESRKSPLLIVLRTASEQIRANAQQLGATPLARARMPEAEPEQMSLADALFADVPVTNE